MKISVWYDDISSVKAFVVDRVDKMGNSNTLKVFGDFIEAMRFGQSLAQQEKLKFEDLTQGW